MLAMVVNDYAGFLAERGALKSIASRLAPTMDRVIAVMSVRRYPLAY
jgi:hypothetical protein